MRRLRVSIGSLAMLLLVLTSAAAAQSSRAVPANDNFANAKPLVLGKSYTVNDIGAASLEAGEPTASCGNGVYNSVWYSFTPAYRTEAYFSTNGTQLFSPPFNSIDTVIAVWTGAALASLSEEECNDDGGSLFSELNIDLTPGVTYYISVGTYDNLNFVSTSFLNLNTRATLAEMPLANGSFEAQLSSTNWKVKNATGDAIVCSNPTYPANTGACAFKFTGDPAGTTAKLSQAVAVPASVALRKNGVVMFYLNSRAFDAVTVAGTKIVLTANYSDGTPSTKQIFPLGSIPVTGSYGDIQLFLYLASGKLTTFKVDIKFKATSGALNVDEAGLFYYATAITRSSLLPLPAAAK